MGVISTGSEINGIGGGEVGQAEFGRPSLRTNFTWVLTGNLIYAASAYAILVVLAKLGGKADVGLYSLGVALAAPTIVLANLGLSNVLLTDVARDCQYGQYLGMRLLSAAAAVVIIAGIALAKGYPYATTLVVVLVGVGASISAVRQILMAVMRRNERMNLSARSQVMVSCGSLLVFSMVFYFTRSLAWAVVGLCVTRTAVLLLHDAPCARALARQVGTTTINPVWSFRPLVSLCRTAAPMAIATTFVSLISNIPKLVLEHYHGVETLGFFAPLVQIMLVGSMLMNSLGTAVTPRLATYYVENRRAYLGLVLRLVLIALCMGGLGVLIAALFGRQLLTLLFNPDYAILDREFVLVMVYMGIMLVVSFVNQAIVSSRGFKHVSLVNASVCGLCIAASWMLIKPYGVMGACWTLLLTSTGWLMILVPVFLFRLRSPAALSSTAAGK